MMDLMEVESPPKCPNCGLRMSRWDDAGAPPGGWYCDGPNDSEVRPGCFTLTPDPPDTTYRWLRSTSTYVDGYKATRQFGLCIPNDIDAEALAELLQVESGAGHFGPDGESVDAHYEITSLDGIEPRIHWEATG